MRRLGEILGFGIVSFVLSGALYSEESKEPGGASGFDWRAASPRELLEGIRARFLPDLTEEQVARLREIGAELRGTVEEKIPALREAGEKFAASLREAWTALPDEEKARFRAFARKVRDLPPPRKLLLLANAIGAEGLDALKEEIAAWIASADAPARIEAGEKIARRAARSIASYLEKTVGLGGARLAALEPAFERFLEETRPARQAIEEAVREKFRAAWGVLTDAQRERLEAMKAWLLGLLKAESP